jgi:integral membrane protein
MIGTMVKSSLGQLRIIGFLEGVSFLVLLLVAMPLKYIWAMPMAVKVVGMAHGVLFILYIVYAIIVSFQQKWSLWTLTLVILASFVPLGTFLADAKIFSKAAERRNAVPETL